jgi:hypothetical protein
MPTPKTLKVVKVPLPKDSNTRVLAEAMLRLKPGEAVESPVTRGAASAIIFHANLFKIGEFSTTTIDGKVYVRRNA